MHNLCTIWRRSLCCNMSQWQRMSYQQMSYICTSTFILNGYFGGWTNIKHVKSPVVLLCNMATCRMVTFLVGSHLFDSSWLVRGSSSRNLVITAKRLATQLMQQPGHAILAPFSFIFSTLCSSGCQTHLATLLSCPRL